jgi:hypothetical protein
MKSTRPLSTLPFWELAIWRRTTDGLANPFLLECAKSEPKPASLAGALFVQSFPQRTGNVSVLFAPDGFPHLSIGCGAFFAVQIRIKSFRWVNFGPNNDF